mmetsp:Transcript_95673/g.200005  ORF Transcript_95673/g.200005 Transcript_95673/m.200005 type:complete len:276 (-) Transcript_95673:3027-3854(-)
MLLSCHEQGVLDCFLAVATSITHNATDEAEQRRGIREPSRLFEQIRITVVPVGHPIQLEGSLASKLVYTFEHCGDLRFRSVPDASHRACSIREADDACRPAALDVLQLARGGLLVEGTVLVHGPACVPRDQGRLEGPGSDVPGLGRLEVCPEALLALGVACQDGPFEMRELLLEGQQPHLGSCEPEVGDFGLAQDEGGAAGAALPSHSTTYLDPFTHALWGESHQHVGPATDVQSRVEAHEIGATAEAGSAKRRLLRCCRATDDSLFLLGGHAFL